MSLKLEDNFIERVRLAIIEDFEKNDLGKGKYLKSLGTNSTYWSSIEKGKMPMETSDILRIAIKLGVDAKTTKWNVAETKVYQDIKEQILHCKNTSSCMRFVDICGIGKTFSARHIAKGLRNVFYIDCSLHKTKSQFIKALAREVGIDTKGSLHKITQELCYYVMTLDKPIFILDEAGDLHESAWLEIKALYNGMEKACGFYMMGANGLRARIQRGIANEKIGYEEISSRYSDIDMSVTPVDKKEREVFMRQVIFQVCKANGVPEEQAKKDARAYAKEGRTLRYVETAIKLSYA